MSNNSYNQPRIADIGDYLKVFACSAVILQPVITMALGTTNSHPIQAGLGCLYDLVKYTAPAFIFGILYTTTRTTQGSKLSNYPQYLKKHWHALFVPTIWWTLIYLLIMPWVQQVNRYTDFKSFLWHFINGNAAPHLWYNTMMLQFIILMPLFWWLASFVKAQPKKGLMTFIFIFIAYFAWLYFYDTNVFAGPHQTDWYLLDRLFISFLIYAVLGVLAWQFRDFYNQILRKFWWLALVGLIICFVWTNHELLSYSVISLANAPYYKPSMTCYSLCVIFLVGALCIYHTNRHSDKILTVFHYLAGFAYKAYLSNIFWLQIIWYLTNQHNFHQKHIWLSLIICWLLSWCVSFGSAILINKIWSTLKAKTFLRVFAEN